MHSTSNLEDGYIGSGKRLWYSIKKHGRENHTVEILEFLPDRSSLKLREQEIVNFDLLKEDLCMNLKIGGEGGNEGENQFFGGDKFEGALNYWKSEIGKNKRIELCKKHLHNEETRDKIQSTKIDRYGSSNGWLGKSHSQETKDRIGNKNSILQKGSNNSQHGTCWITNGFENKKIKKENLIPDGWKLGRK